MYPAKFSLLILSAVDKDTFHSKLLSVSKQLMSLLKVVSEDIDLRFLWLLTARLSSALASCAMRKPASPNCNKHFFISPGPYI